MRWAAASGFDDADEHTEDGVAFIWFPGEMSV
jgi:hypothetical protein